jgi:hypothetical protein
VTLKKVLPNCNLRHRANAEHAVKEKITVNGKTIDVIQDLYANTDPQTNTKSSPKPKQSH